LIIAVDATKFIEPTLRHQSLVTKEEWSEIIESYSKRIVIVSAPMRLDTDPAKVSEFEQEINKFRKAGVHIDI
jgi:hypothetical protein